MPKRTWQPKKKQRQQTHGFLVRMHSHGGKGVIQRRRLKGRQRLAV